MNAYKQTRETLSTKYKQNTYSRYTKINTQKYKPLKIFVSIWLDEVES